MLQILHVVAIGKFKLRRSLKQAVFFTLSVGDMVYSTHKKPRRNRFKGLKAPTIAKILVEEEGLGVTRQGVQSFLKRYRETRTIGGRPGDGRSSVLSQKMSRRLWRLKCRQVVNFKVPCYEID